MSVQPTLFGDAPAPPPELHPRQQLVLDTLRAAGHDGLHADEVGAAIHEYRGRHDRGTRCDYCAREGGQVLKRLRELGHVRRDRHGNWYALDLPEREGAYDPATAEIPF